MKTLTHHFSEQQIARLQGESERTGLTVAELVRRAVDLMLPPDTGVEPIRYKGHTATLRAVAERRGLRWQVVFKGECKTDLGSLFFEADSIKDAQKLFEWNIDRQPQVHAAINEAMQKEMKRIKGGKA